MDNLWIIYGSGWWYTNPSETYEFVNWDDDIPNIWENKNVPNHQPDIVLNLEQCEKMWVIIAGWWLTKPLRKI